MENSKKEYIAPQLTMVEIKSERGYAASNSISLFSLYLGGASIGQLENYTEHEDWTQSGGFWD